MLQRSLANIYDQHEEYAKSESLYREVLPNLKETLGDENINTFSTMRTLAVAIAQQDRNAEALPMFRESYQLAQRTLPPNSVNLTIFMNSYASALTRAGEFNEAESILTQAISMVETASPNSKEAELMLSESMIELYTNWNIQSPSPEREAKLNIWLNP
jgi:tetratricopeptide (TPR) repeat protein